MIGAKLMIEETWLKAGVFNVEQLNPTPFMDELNQNGLNWNIHEQD